MAETYDSIFTEEMIKEPTAPKEQSAISKEKFFYDVYKPSVGGDAGLLSFFPSGGRGQGQVDGSPRVPNFDQFLKGESTYSHRHDGKVYGMKAIRPTAEDFNTKYNAYVDEIKSKNELLNSEYKKELEYTKAAKEIYNLAKTKKIDTNFANEAIKNLSIQRDISKQSRGTPDVGQIASSEAMAVQGLLNLAKEKNPSLGTLAGLQYVPSPETPPRNAIEFFISGGIGGSTLVPNPEYDQAAGRAWKEKKRNEMYEFASKYVPKEELNATRERFDSLYKIGATNVMGASDISTLLNFQISDQKIIDDLNASRLARLQNIAKDGYTQIAGIQERISSARDFANKLPEGDSRRKAAESAIQTMISDLSSVNSAITLANNQIKNFKQITVNDEEGLRDITAFREFIRLPEERATQQLRQIDPESYQTAVELGQRYRQMATEPLPATTSPQTEALRSTIEQEAINQLALGAQLGAEEQRQYQQAARAAQTARGNVFGVAPAVEEAVTTGAAGEQRKLARYGAAAQFLTSGETTGAALQRDIAFRDALLQNRLGAASGFIAGGPTLANLAQARTAQQQAAFQNYIQANQALPGQFGQAPSTAQPFYQAVDQGIPVNLTSTFANLYGSMADYQARTYGAYTAAQASRPTFAQQFGQIATGIGNLFSPFKFS